MALYGKTSQGSLWKTIESRYRGIKITLAGSETGVRFRAFLRSVGSPTNGIKVGLWNSTGTTLLYESASLGSFTDETGGWKDITFTDNIAAGTYWMAIVAENMAGGLNYVEIAFDTLSSDSSLRAWWYYGETWPNLRNDLTADSGSGGDYGTDEVSLYLETAASGVAGDMAATESGADALAASGGVGNNGVRLTLRDTDTGALATNLTGLIVSIREASDDEATLYKTTSATTDAGGVCEIASLAIGDIGDYVTVTVEKSDNSIVASYRVQVIDLNA